MPTHIGDGYDFTNITLNENKNKTLEYIFIMNWDEVSRVFAARKVIQLL